MKRLLLAALALAGCKVEYLLDASSCETPLTLCDGSCVDLSEDPDHCGECEARCEAADECTVAGCVTACGQEQLRCDVECVDPQSSAAHCGGCDQPCRGGAQCHNGQCVDACSGVCDSVLQICVAGACACRAGLQLCDGRCVDTDNSALHCGDCGNDCSGSACAGGVCRADGCAGFPDRCRDACTDTSRDPLNCGECGMQCAADAVCYRGECILAVPSGCDSCPCVACDRADRVCFDPRPYGSPICVARGGA